MRKPRYGCNTCSFGTDVRVVMKDHAAVLGHFGWTDSEAEDAFPETLTSFTMEMSFNEVDPDVLGILTGGVMGNPPAPTFSIHVAYPARRRTFWEWLRRKPKHHAGSVYIPNARLAQDGEDDD